MTMAIIQTEVAHGRTAIYSPKPTNHDHTSKALSADGRIARRQRNRERVVDAYVHLMFEGVARPTATELAERAEVTPRTVYRYMREDLALQDDVAERAVSAFYSSPSLDDVDSALLRDRIDAFVTSRLDAYERSSPVMRALRSHQIGDPIVMHAIGVARGITRGEIDRCFAPELDRLDTTERLATVVSLQTAVLFESLEHVHEQVEHSQCDVHGLLCRLFETILASANVSIESFAS